MIVLKCFFIKIVKFILANFGYGISICLRPGQVSLVLFDPFCNLEALNNIIVLHLLHAAAIENAPPPPPRQYLPRVERIRDDPFTLPDREFKRQEEGSSPAPSYTISVLCGRTGLTLMMRSWS